LEEVTQQGDKRQLTKDEKRRRYSGHERCQQTIRLSDASERDQRTGRRAEMNCSPDHLAGQGAAGGLQCKVVSSTNARRKYRSQAC